MLNQEVCEIGCPQYTTRTQASRPLVYVKNLMWIAPRYVSRIKIQQGGYGKALYINHPNGVTSVYAHLQRYSPDIIPHVRKKQYSRKNYTIEFYPEPDQMPIKKGALIGYSGNTGSSFGPHLHFELRTSANQSPFNPLLADDSIAC